MGSLVGHVIPGFAFFALGFWHLFNQINLHFHHPNSYTSYPWFPTSKLRYIELLSIMLGSSISISMELFIGPAKHQPFDPDGTIPSNHLRNFEHSSISMTFFTYAAFAILLDKINPKAKFGLTQFLGAIAFSQQLLVFHLHSTDHMGVEGQYHLLLECVIVVSLATTIMGIGLPNSFMVSFVRSLSVLFQGLWFILMGYFLWTPSLIPKGCFLHSDDGQQIVSCSTDEALQRAKSLVNMLFSWVLIVVSIFAVTFYLVLGKLHGRKLEYSTLTKEEDLELEDNNYIDDLESKKETKRMGKGYAVLDSQK